MSYRPFEAVRAAPPDPILGLNEQFNQDANPQKVNLSIGIYQDETGHSPVLSSVKQAEKILLEQETTKAYLAIPGDPVFADHVRELVFGPEHPAVAAGTMVTIQAPGGTGAIRVGADFIASEFANPTVWISDPSWPVHRGIFAGVGKGVRTYPYLDAGSRSFHFEGMLKALEETAEGDVVVMHAACHNPTGFDPTPEQWDRLAEWFSRRPILPFFDLAYQGFGKGLDEDAYAVRMFAERGLELLVANSYSKNFGLYRERVGALTLLSSSPAAANRALSRLKVVVRNNYSNPPAHGGLLVALVLSTPDLRKLWLTEVEGMRGRIRSMREGLVEGLRKAGIRRDFSFLTAQQGMFSFSGLGEAEAARLREDFSVYILDNGRINVAGLTPQNMDYVCQSIAAVLGE